ncbi:MAG: ABC transporter permease [Deltaproteobacteria bacterium]|nr:ABC transporter permease [Deltaproteobacteria bacterium]
MKTYQFLRRFPGLFRMHRHTLFLMIERDFKTRYVQSVGGVFWAFLNPLLLVLVYSLIFSLVFSREVGDVPFSLWLFSALLPWLFFSDVLKNAVTILEKNKNLIIKSPFQPELLSLVVIGAGLVGHLAGIGIILLLLLLFGHFPGVCVLTLLFYTVCLLFFCLGLSWIVSALYLFVRDIGQFIHVILQLWFYLCPIVYPDTIIPEKYVFLYRLNPMYFIVQGYRRALIYNQSIVWVDFFIFAGWACLFLLAGSFIFGRLKNQFAEML